MEIIRTESLGFYDDSSMLIIPAKQADTGRTINIEVEDKLENVNAVWIRQLTPNNAQYYITSGITYSNGIVTIDMSKNANVVGHDGQTTSIILGNVLLSTPGINKCELIFCGANNTVLTSWKFHIFVQESVHENTDLITSSYSDLVNVASMSTSEAKYYMESAITSATNAKNSQDTAEICAKNSQYYLEQVQKIAVTIGKPLQPRGTLTFAQLPSQEILDEKGDDYVGYTYNISERFTIPLTDDRFIDGIKGNTYQAGTNVYVYKTEDKKYKYDVLSGFNYWYGTMSDYNKMRNDQTLDSNTLYFTLDDENSYRIATDDEIDAKMF